MGQGKNFVQNTHAPDNSEQATNHSELNTSQLLEVLLSFKKGDLSKRMPPDLKGVEGKIADTLNEIIDRHEIMIDEFDNVSQLVGKKGKIDERIPANGYRGSWRSMVNCMNLLIDDLTWPTTEMARVIGGVARGDLTQQMEMKKDGDPLKGEFLRTSKVVNTMVSQLGSFASEVTRVAREVGTEGKLGGQAQVEGVSGTWKDLTENVNQLAGNLTDQVRNIAEVTTAVARGDLSKKITVNVKGEIQELKETINTMVDQLSSFASEVTRVARDVGTEGKLGGQADVKGVSGTWKDLTDNVNLMADNLTDQVRSIAEVTTAVAKGDLSKKITVTVKGEIQELKKTINTMVDQLSSFASEVTRVAREVGTEGQLGAQADVPGVSGTWKDLTDNVNQLAGNLTVQLRDVSKVATAIAQGDLSRKITVDAQGEILEIKDTINNMIDILATFADQVTTVAREVGTDGKLGGQAEVQGVSGTWKDLTDNVNLMANNLTDQVRNIAEVTTAVAQGDLSKKITVDVKGEIQKLKETINTMVDQLSSFASEVTRVAREVGTEGKLGGQAQVKGVSGTWEGLTNNVNLMANKLTDQVRGIAEVTTAVAKGNLTKKITVDAQGEIQELKETINTMVDQLGSFASEVTRVAREVGTEGKLGGQADVPGVSGTWENLTDNVNQLANNLTTQVRAIADVATAVTEGDLTRSITVRTSGEVEELKNNINEMIQNLRETTTQNTQQDWLKTNLAKFTRMLQGQKNLHEVSRLLLSELAPVVSAQHAVFYSLDHDLEKNQDVLSLLAAYGYKKRRNVADIFAIGEGLIGQCALDKKRIILRNVPAEYIQINSGLGEASPLNIVVLPVVFEGEVKAVIELASFQHFSETHLSFLEQLTESIGIVLNTIEATMRTEGLLKQSQSLARELQNQQEELQQTNEELEEKAHLLAVQKTEVESKNQEVEYAKKALEEKAAQLQLTSKYKSEFLANMSHELRTPLNSLLILAEQLKVNHDNNLSLKQVEFANTIHAAGTDLMNLINDILDLSKIESGTVSVEIGKVLMETIKEDLRRTFQHMADSNKDLELAVDIDQELPETIFTDRHRLQQILNNLLSNAFKFTNKGKIELFAFTAQNGWSPENDALNQADSVIAFAVKDTGMGIPYEKQRIIFEAFQQADGSTSRRYGGTGLGLAISREIAQLLGGELCLTKSKPGKGSIFTFYMPQTKIKALKSGENVNHQREALQPNNAIDDRNDIQDEDRVLLLIGNDDELASSLMETARNNNFKVLMTSRGQEGLAMVNKFRPHAISLDIQIPDMEGWTVLDRIKMNPRTRHIPVQIISDSDEQHFGFERGAFSYLLKPVQDNTLEKAVAELKTFFDTPVKKALVVANDSKARQSIISLIGNGDVVFSTAASGKEAVNRLRNDQFNCLVLNLDSNAQKGLQILQEIMNMPKLNRLPLIIYSENDVSKNAEILLQKITGNNILKRVHSKERLLDVTSLFLHLNPEQLSQDKQELIHKIYETDNVLTGKKVLVVDDDIRNIFALTSVLERHHMSVVTAENGKEALKLIKKESDINVILMDIMMPEMDGYETMLTIRKMPAFKSLPILALTAKAMKGDREKCIKAGASDYITKPVDTNQLLSLLRVWMYR